MIDRWYESVTVPMSSRGTFRQAIFYTEALNTRHHLCLTQRKPEKKFAINSKAIVLLQKCFLI